MLDNEMTISKTQFRWLLGFYFLLVILEFIPIPVPLGATSQVSTTINNAEPEIVTESLLVSLLMVTFLLVIVGAGLIGFLGMFCFWTPIRYIFSVAIILKTLAFPLLDKFGVIGNGRFSMLAALYILSQWGIIGL